MISKRVAIAAVLSSVVFIPASASAFECPKHIAAAKQAIDKVLGDMKGMGKMMKRRDLALVHAMVDDAKMLLASAQHNHAKPRGRYDHGRAIAKAHAARGYAIGAEILHFKMMQAMKKMRK
ncbi:MAG: hypothetical protein O7I42_18425 [Alphaproteobacteria bacterium]|nr:hypothetical protein [Alphaproteobacteria bacterium]